MGDEERDKNAPSTGKGLKHGPGKTHNGVPCTHVLSQDKPIDQIAEEVLAEMRKSGRVGKKDDEL